MKSNRRGMTEAPWQQHETPEKEDASNLGNINADLNSDKANSTPYFQSQEDGINDNAINPTITERKIREFDLHEDIQQGKNVMEDTVDSTAYHKVNVGPVLNSPENEASFVKPGLVKEVTAKWVRSSRPTSSHVEVNTTAQLGKCHTEASSTEHPEAKRRSLQNGLGRVHSPAPDSHANALVSSLINHVDRCWREAEIDSLFLPEEAAIIKTIPLSLFDQADLPFWPYTRDGLFSVKSGYHLSMEQDGTELTGTSIAGATSPCWKAIWRMHVPNRVKSLVWRAGNNALPTRVNLVRRHILTDSMCPECMNQPEDTMHALWSCPKLQDMWKVNFNKLVTDTSSCSSFDEILECASKGKSSFDLFAMLVSEVWQRRNRVRVGEPTVLLSQINSKAFSALQEFQQLRPTHTVIPRTARAVKWRPPTAPCVKHDLLRMQ
nr:putative ribonuclease h protein [Quercus suber]